jgi:ABC-type lipoprotein release transport system permease subunit
MVIAKIALRNLVRQKRRNFLLGICIAFGMCILVLLNSFSNGVADIILNKIAVYAFGHIRVERLERVTTTKQIIRDRERFVSLIKENIAGIQYVSEGVSIPFCRALGNGEASNIVIVGIPSDGLDPGMGEVLSGNIDDFAANSIENPVVIYKQAAKDLNVDVMDVIRCRFRTIHGQVQTGRFTVVAILQSQNMFMNQVSFANVNNLKSLLGLRESEVNTLSVVFEKLNDPSLVIREADKLHSLLQPEIICYGGVLWNDRKSKDVLVFGFRTDAPAVENLEKMFPLEQGSWNKAHGNAAAIIVSNGVARELDVEPGDRIKAIYVSRFDRENIQTDFILEGIFSPGGNLRQDMVFVHPDHMYTTYYEYLPEKHVSFKNDNDFTPLLLREWELLPRSRTSQEFGEKSLDLRKKKWKGAVLDVQTMYEAASQVTDMQYAFMGISFIGIIILFIIILIGVINTLRMSIRERTREIGTMRAIGMQRGGVLRSFVYEILFLNLTACVVGILVAGIIMFVLGLIIIEAGENPFGFLLLDKHLHFVVSPIALFLMTILITGIAVVISLFTARRAARIKPVEALRHYE